MQMTGHGRDDDADRGAQGGYTGTTHRSMRGRLIPTMTPIFRGNVGPRPLLSLAILPWPTATTIVYMLLNTTATQPAHDVLLEHVLDIFIN